MLGRLTFWKPKENESSAAPFEGGPYRTAHEYADNRSVAQRMHEVYIAKDRILQSKKDVISEKQRKKKEAKRIQSTIKVNAKTNLDKNVANVDSHISFVECFFSDSSEI